MDALNSILHQPELMAGSVFGVVATKDLKTELKKIPSTNELVGVRFSGGNIEVFHPEGLSVKVPAQTNTSEVNTSCVWVYRKALMDNLNTITNSHIEVELCPDDTPKLLTSVTARHKQADWVYRPRTDNLDIEPRASMRIHTPRFRVRLSGKVAPAPVAQTSQVVWQVKLTVAHLYGAIPSTDALPTKGIYTSQALSYQRIVPYISTVRFVATDGYRLHISDVSILSSSGELTPIFVEGKAWKDFLKTLGKPSNKQVTLSYEKGKDENEGVLVGEVQNKAPVRMPCQHIQYPLYETVIPYSFALSISIEDIAPFLSSLKIMQSSSRGNAFACHLRVEKQQDGYRLVASTNLRSSSFFEASAGIAAYEGEVEQFKATLDVRYLVDVVRWCATTDKPLVLKTNKEASRVLFEIRDKDAGWDAWGIIMCMQPAAGPQGQESVADA